MNPLDFCNRSIDPPKDLIIHPLPIRSEWPEISETVYAVGAPLSTRLQSTMNAGIVSAHRKDFKFMGTKQNFIQADVTTHGGNSGGPLLDENGNVAGLLTGGIVLGSADAGLNFFIPIGEAMDVLRIYPE